MRPNPPLVLRDLDVGPRGNLAARWLYEPQPVSNQWTGVGFPNRAGAVSTPGGIIVFAPGLLDSQMYGGNYVTGMEYCPPRMRMRATIEMHHFFSVIPNFRSLRHVPKIDLGRKIKLLPDEKCHGLDIQR